MQRIVLANTQSYAIVDDEDYKLVSEYEWHYLNGHAVTWVADKLMYMRWLVLGFYMWGFLVRIQHFSGNHLDNRRCNLSLSSTTSSRYAPRSQQVGVSWREASKKWQAALQIDGKRVYVGVYEKEEEAIAAYRAAAIEHGLPIKSRYKGVYYSMKTNKWRAQIYLSGKQKSLGYFTSEEEASLTYQVAAAQRASDKAKRS